MTNSSPTCIGIDVGALYLKVALLDKTGRISNCFYARHHGDPVAQFSKAMDELQIQGSVKIGLTGTHAEKLALKLGLTPLDLTFCQIQGVKILEPDATLLIDIGGVSSTLIQLDKKGEFQGYSTNSLCAAGTGSFLDEQAARLGIAYEDTQKFDNVESPPTIATRCSVFAKSDLIHRQQEGYSQHEMWSGLCRGMTKTLFGTLLHGRPLDAKTAIIGGVALNREVIRWLKDAYPRLIIVPQHPHLVASLGAANHGTLINFSTIKIDTKDNDNTEMELSRYPWPLTMEKSQYPSFETHESYVDDENTEVRIHKPLMSGQIDIYLGIDIGSTSTKAILMNADYEVLIDIYRKTLGNPIQATKHLFKAIREISEARQIHFNVLGTGTTGSGRKIVGNLIGADAIVNEISAHVAGAHQTDPTIDTIFEIGGQDSKYMYLVDGHIRESNMNYVCAAGTGSFVEEQANKLGFKIQEAGPKVIGTHPPRATDRCTVFMEQDIVKLTQSGATSKEVFSSVMVSVTKNYLNKVVGNRYYNRDKIFFQGATARNPALVAAFERLLGVEVVVSPLCHVMGSYGVALITKEMMSTKESSKSTFRGLDLEKRKISIRKEECNLCQNDCAITYADIEGEDKSPSWGYMCGREPDDERVRVTKHDRFIRRRERLWLEAGRGIDVPASAPVIGIPQALSTYTYLPLWRRFFSKLGYNIQLSGPTTEEIRELGSRLSGAEFCFPAKVFMGHAAYLTQKKGADFIFAPQMSFAGKNEHTSAAVFCPYVQGTSAYTRSAFLLNSIDESRILNPLVDMRLDDKAIARNLTTVLKKPLGRTFRQIREAWTDALAVQKDFEQKCFLEGQQAITEAKAKNEKIIVLIGRPYNNFDKGLNLGLPKKLSEYGRTVLPMDFIKPDLSKLKEKYRNTYWNYGQKILAVLEEIRESDIMDAVYLTNFSCGPDSFLLTYAEEIMGNRPFLALELDEHGSDTGYVTRIEAFFDVLTKPRQKNTTRRTFKAPIDDFKDRTLWIPNMHPYGTDLMAASLRSEGYDARAIPMCTPETYEEGRTLTRGSECLPTSLTIGRLIKTLKSPEARGKKQAFFMPTAQGPCRFGQYATLHRDILDREGFSDVSILSPTSFNGYQGLDETIRRMIWKALVSADVIQKSVCKVRPYELNRGETDHVAVRVLKTIAREIENKGNIPDVIHRSVERIFKVPTKERKNRPLVGVVGEIYVRNNSYANEELIRSIEDMGGEAWATPVSEWMLFTNCPQNIAEHHAHKFTKKTVQSFIKWRWLNHWEKKIYDAASPWLDDRHEPHVNEILKEGKTWFRTNIGGEAILTVGRSIKYGHQGAHMVVNVAPFCCMPGTVTTAIFRRVSQELNMPIVNLFYDGTGGQNQRLKVYLENALRKVA